MLSLTKDVPLRLKVISISRRKKNSHGGPNPATGLGCLARDVSLQGSTKNMLANREQKSSPWVIPRQISLCPRPQGRVSEQPGKEKKMVNTAASNGAGTVLSAD